MLFNAVKAIIERITNWHNWPFYIFYSPISYVLLGYYIKTRSLWFYTASNPTIAFGGFEGETKSEIYQQLPQELCPKSIYIHPSLSFTEVVNQLYLSGLTYPFVVKPDINMKGLLFRKIESEQQLKIYHSQIPATYIIQEFINLPYEVSIFYCRKPASNTGIITAFIKKYYLRSQAMELQRWRT